MKQNVKSKKSFVIPQLIASGKIDIVDAKACTRRMSGKNHCSIRPNTN